MILYFLAFAALVIGYAAILVYLAHKTAQDIRRRGFEVDSLIFD